MAMLDNIKPGTVVRGVVPEEAVQVVSVERIGNQAISLVYRQPKGGVSETVLYRGD